MAVDPHAFAGDLLGDCEHCPLPEGHPVHVKPSAPPVVTSDGKRPINLLTKDEGMGLAATSRASEDFRETFFLAMAEVATTREFFSTNDAWDLLEARGYVRSGSAQATGTVGPSGASIGLWKRTDQKVLNTSGNLHSSDDGVRLYRSLIVGKDFAEVAGPVRVKAAALREKAEAREAERAAATAVADPNVVKIEQFRVTDMRDVDGYPNGWSGEMSKRKDAEHLIACRGGRLQRRTVILSPWEDA